MCYIKYDIQMELDALAKAVADRRKAAAKVKGDVCLSELDEDVCLESRSLFNRYTVPVAQRWLNRQNHNTALTRWMYWKVLLHHTNVGYRAAAPRRPARVVTLPPVGAT